MEKIDHPVHNLKHAALDKGCVDPDVVELERGTDAVSVPVEMLQTGRYDAFNNFGAHRKQEVAHRG